MTSATQTKENLFKTLINNMDNSTFSKHNDFLNYHKQQKVLNEQINFRKKVEKNFCQLMLNDINKDLEELNFQKKFAEKRNDTILSDIQKQNFKSYDISTKTNDSKNKLKEGKNKFQDYLNQQYAIIKNDFILQFYNKQNDLIVQHAIMKNQLRENEKQLKLEDEYLNNINALNEELLNKIKELKNQNDIINQERDKKNMEILLLQKRYNEDMIKALNEPIKPLEKEPVLRAKKKIIPNDTMFKTTKNFNKFKEYYLVLNMNHKRGILDDIRQKKIDLINKKIKEETDKEIKNFAKTARYSPVNIKAMINNFLSNSLKIDDFNRSSKDDYNINSNIGDENISNKNNTKFKSNFNRTEKKRSKSISTISNHSSLNQKKINDEKSDIKMIEKKSNIISNEVSLNNNASNINNNHNDKSYISNKATIGLTSNVNIKLNENNKNNENKEIKLNPDMPIYSNKKLHKIENEKNAKKNNILKDSQKSNNENINLFKLEEEYNKDEEEIKENNNEQNIEKNEEDKKENDEEEDIKENNEENKENEETPLKQIIREKPPLNDERVLPEYKLKILEKIINNIEIYAKKQKPGKLIYAKKHSNTKNNKDLIKNKFYDLLNSLEFDSKENSDKLFNNLDIDMAMQFLFELLNTNHANNLDFNNLQTNNNYNENDFENELDNYYLDIYLKILEHFKKMIKEKRISLQIAVNFLSKALLNIDNYDNLMQGKLNLILEKKLSKKSSTTNNNLFNTNTLSGGFNLQSTGSMGFQQFNTQNNFSSK